MYDGVAGLNLMYLILNMQQMRREILLIYQTKDHPSMDLKSMLVQFLET